MSWTIRHDGTDEYLKVLRGDGRRHLFVFSTRKEAMAKIDRLSHLVGWSLVPVEVDLPVTDKVKLHKFKRGKRGRRRR